MSSSQLRVYYDYRIVEDKFVYNIPFISDTTGMTEGEIWEIMEKIVERH
jgi:hypothetical protein